MKIIKLHDVYNVYYLSMLNSIVVIYIVFLNAYLSLKNVNSYSEEIQFYHSNMVTIYLYNTTSIALCDL